MKQENKCKLKFAELMAKYSNDFSKDNCQKNI